MMMMMRMFLKPSHTLKPAAAAAMSSSSAGAKPRSVYVVNCEKPQDKDPKDFYIRTLTAVLGSEEAANKAYITDFGYHGFSVANLTPEQADQISKQPCISRVYQNNRTYNLGRWRRFHRQLELEQYDAYSLCE